MAEKDTGMNKREPKSSSVFNPVQSFDDSFVVMDNPDDDFLEQHGNGITLVTNDNPDDLEDKLVR